MLEMTDVATWPDLAGAVSIARHGPQPFVITGAARADIGLLLLLGFLVIRGEVAEPLSLAAGSLLRYLPLLLMPPEAEGVVGYRGEAEAFNFEHHRASVTQALQRLLQFADAANAPGIALQSAPIANCLPGLLGHHALPLLDASVPPRLWIGNRVTTPAHFDEYHNIACVVCGVRRFTLFPPEQVRNLYIGPLDFAPTGAAISMARLDRLDDPRYPRLQEAMAHAQVAELEPGDAIYIPPMWWHHVASLGRLNALVNYWWKKACVVS